MWLNFIEDQRIGSRCFDEWKETTGDRWVMGGHDSFEGAPGERIPMGGWIGPFIPLVQSKK